MVQSKRGDCITPVKPIHRTSDLVQHVVCIPEATVAPGFYIQISVQIFYSGNLDEVEQGFASKDCGGEDAKMYAP